MLDYFTNMILPIKPLIAVTFKDKKMYIYINSMLALWSL